MNRGFMLLEVVLALSIFIVAVVGLVKVLNAGLDADYEQRRLTNMRLHLQSLMDEALVGGPLQTPAELPADGFHVSYRRTVEPAELRLSGGKKLRNIFKITVTAHDTLREDRVIGTLWTYASP